MRKAVLFHGDVSFYEADKIPETAKKIKWERKKGL